MKITHRSITYIVTIISHISLSLNAQPSGGPPPGGAFPEPNGSWGTTCNQIFGTMGNELEIDGFCDMPLPSNDTRPAELLGSEISDGRFDTEANQSRIVHFKCYFEEHEGGMVYDNGRHALEDIGWMDGRVITKADTSRDSIQAVIDILASQLRMISPDGSYEGYRVSLNIGAAHGSVQAISFGHAGWILDQGPGFPYQTTGYISNLMDTLRKYSDIIQFVRFNTCNVGNDPDFLQRIADDLGCPVQGYTDCTASYPRGTFGNWHDSSFYTVPEGTDLVTRVPSFGGRHFFDKISQNENHLHIDRNIIYAHEPIQYSLMSADGFNSLRVSNSSGQLVQEHQTSMKNGQLTLDVKLSPGLYFITAMFADGKQASYPQKLIIK